MDDERADSKLSKLGTPEPKPDVLLVEDEVLYQSGTGAAIPVPAWYFCAHNAAVPAATANGM